jgi:lipoic acid synthetase
MNGNLKPQWLNKKIDLTDCRKIKTLLRSLSLHTVCEEAKCPNIGECFNCGVVTIMILGSSCTRGCKFCGVSKEKPVAIDLNEPQRVKAAVDKLKLKYVVVTSPTRDDLSDGGLSQFINTVDALKDISKKLRVEILVPDFLGQHDLWKRLAGCSADVISHNVETVPSLYRDVRQGSDYRRSLDLLKTVKEVNSAIVTKSGLMLGLGETKEEVLQVLLDLRMIDCDIITIGQYLAPSKKHHPVKKYVDLKEFKFFEQAALDLGFKQVRSSPYVRSSYLAEYPR